MESGRAILLDFVNIYVPCLQQLPYALCVPLEDCPMESSHAILRGFVNLYVPCLQQLPYALCVSLGGCNMESGRAIFVRFVDLYPLCLQQRIHARTVPQFGSFIQESFTIYGFPVDIGNGSTQQLAEYGGIILRHRKSKSIPQAILCPRNSHK